MIVVIHVFLIRTAVLRSAVNVVVCFSWRATRFSEMSPQCPLPVCRNLDCMKFVWKEVLAAEPSVVFHVALINFTPVCHVLGFLCGNTIFTRVMNLPFFQKS